MQKIFNILFAEDLCFQSSGRSRSQTQRATNAMWFSYALVSDDRGVGEIDHAGQS